MSQHKEASDTTESSASGHLRHISDHRCLFRAELESLEPDTTRLESLETSGRVEGEGGHCDYATSPSGMESPDRVQIAGEDVLVISGNIDIGTE